MLAAALATLGFPVRPRKVHDDRSGDKDVTWQIGGGNEAMPVCNLGILLEAVKTGKLEATDPDHPLLDCIRALRNRERLLKHLLNGQPLTLARDVHCARSSFVNAAAAEPPVSLGRSVTRDFRFVCAAGILGFGLVGWKGTDGHHEFTITEKSIFPGMLLASVIFRKLNDGTLEKDTPEHPIIYGMMACRNYSRLVKHLESAGELVLLRPKGTERRAWIDPTASDRAWDKVRKHFKV